MSYCQYFEDAFRLHEQKHDQAVAMLEHGYSPAEVAREFGWKLEHVLELVEQEDEE